MYLCKFGQNPSIGSKDNARKRSNADADPDGIRTKNNMSPPPSVGGHNTNLDLVTDNVYTNFGLILSIRSQDIEQKPNFDVNQRP